MRRFVDRVLGLPEETTPAVESARDLRVPMPDGTVLRADLHRPRGAGPLPAVLIRTPYGKAQRVVRLFTGVLARRGFQVVVQDVRGIGDSNGDFRAFHHERDDGLATLKWLRAQPWCDGRVAMAGASYLGFTQWAVAPYADPPLAALGLGITASEFAGSFYPGGALALFNTLVWSSSMGRRGATPEPPPTCRRGATPEPPPTCRRVAFPEPASASVQGATPEAASMRTRVGRFAPLHGRRVRRAMRHLPVGEADLAAIGRPEPFLRDVTAHTEPGDGFWDATDHSAAVPATTAPASMVTGWWDLFLRGQLRDFAGLDAAGRGPRITIGPWGHDVRALRAVLADQVSWLGAHLHGDAAELRRAPVRLYLQKADRWLDFDRWPPPETEPTPLYLAQGLVWGEPDETEPATFVYDPFDPTPNIGGPLLSPGKGRQRDNAAMERRDDVAVLTGAPLDRDLDLIGPVSATIHVRTSTGHGDLFVRLCDVDRNGVSRNVTDGILRITEPGIVRAEVEMHPTGYRFRRGHRLRVVLAGGAFPRFARNPGTGEPTGRAVAMRRTAFEVFRGPSHPSALTLPVWRG